jgi:hypothetical protein
MVFFSTAFEASWSIDWVLFIVCLHI